MSGFSLPTNFVENPEKIVRRVRPRVVPPPLSQSTREPAFQAPSTITEPKAEKTLRDFSVPSAANVATGPNVDIGDVNFELKYSLINMVQASPFCGKPNEDANAHLQNFLELCKTMSLISCTPVKKYLWNYFSKSAHVMMEFAGKENHAKDDPDSESGN